MDGLFPAEATHDRLAKVLRDVFDLKIEKGESTAACSGKVRAAFPLLRFAKLSPERKAVVVAAPVRTLCSKQLVTQFLPC